MEWQHSTSGFSTGEVTREYRCQNCGGWQVKKPRSRTIAFWILGGIFTLTTCVFGLPFLYLAWRDQKFDERVRVVPGVPAPRLRYPGGPPKRTCGKCGGLCVATNITRHTHRGLPTGEEYDYQCGGCQAKFTTENLLGHFTSTGAGLIIAAMAAGFLVAAKSPGWRWGGGLVASALALFMLGQVGARVVAKLQNPVREEAVR